MRRTNPTIANSLLARCARLEHSLSTMSELCLLLPETAVAGHRVRSCAAAAEQDLVRIREDICLAVSLISPHPTAKKNHA